MFSEWSCVINSTIYVPIVSHSLNFFNMATLVKFRMYICMNVINENQPLKKIRNFSHMFILHTIHLKQIFSFYSFISMVSSSRTLKHPWTKEESTLVECLVDLMKREGGS